MQNATFAGGRKPPHAERRAWEITDRAGESLRQAEVMVRAVADAALEDRARDLEGLRRRVDARWWVPEATVEALERACRDLRAAAGPWDTLAEGSSLRLSWPR